MNEINSQKKNLRKILAQKRDLIKKNVITEFNTEAFNELIKYINFENIKYVASFISIRSEISTIQLNKKIIELNKILTFPVIKNNSQELIFKPFDLNENLKLGKFNIPEPTTKKDSLVPQLFFVPCLGFDLNGYRLGYGGGYYDKTFANLNRINHKFYTVGFAFDKQKQPSIPKDKLDYKLDFILTEKQLYKFL